MYKDYLDAIIRHYELQKKQQSLPQPMWNPTPAKLRDLCVAVYVERVENRDMETLRRFFETPGDGDLLKAIRRFGIDKFRPLVNFLNGDTKAPDDKNIQLLGWLLNFPRRPFDKTLDYQGGGLDEPNFAKTQPEIAAEEPEFVVKEPDVAPRNELMHAESGKEAEHIPNEVAVTPNAKRKNRTLLVALAVMAVGISTYFIYQGTKTTSFIAPGQKNCMIWTGDHYQSIACDSLASRGLAQGLDSLTLINCRRITRPDTISAKDIGKIWYQKRGKDSMEYYTGGGRDPLNPNCDLHRLTRYMYNKHFQRGLD